jgi:hypothetical protein
VQCFHLLKLRIRTSVFTEVKLNQVDLPLVWIQFFVFSKLLRSVFWLVTSKEEHIVLGKKKIASGREARVVRFGSNQ